MPKAFAWILAAVTVLVLALFGLAIAVALTRQEPPSGSLDTDLEGVTVSAETTTVPEPEPPPEPVGDRGCWRTFGADPQALPRPPRCDLGLPARKFTWARGLGSYIEFPPVYCEGELYVNGFSGTTFAIDAETGKIRWTRRVGGTLPSSPAIDGPRILVASQDGTVTALGRRVRAKALAGAHRRQGRVVAGRRRRARRTSARTTAGCSRCGRTPVGSAGHTRPGGGSTRARPCSAGRCASTTYAGSFVCLDRDTGGRAVDDVPQARRVPLRELLCQPVERRRADLQRRAFGQGRRARRLERAHRLDGRRRRARLHDARGRRRTRVRGRLRRPPARVPRDVGRRALEHPGSTVASSARPSSSDRTSSSRRSRSTRTRCASPTARSPGASRSGSTRRASRPNGPTSSR